MTISIKVDMGGAIEELQILADSFGELQPAFARFGAWLRKDVQGVFDSQGNGQWAPRKVATESHQESRVAARITRIEANKYRSLIGSLKHSKKRVEKSILKTKSSKLLSRRQKSVARYEAQMLEIQRLEQGGEKQPKGQKKLYERVQRREDRAAKRIEAVKSGKLLAGIAASLRTASDKSSFSMFSAIKWAFVHNDGGIAGHNALEPQRRFLEWTPERIQMFVQICNEYLTERAEKVKKRG